MHICLYIHIYIYTYIHKCIYMYISRVRGSGWMTTTRRTVPASAAKRNARQKSAAPQNRQLSMHVY